MELILPVLTLETTSQFVGEELIVTLAVLLMVILVVPIVFERLRLPGFIGLVFSGLVLGPYGWNLFRRESALFSLLSDVGLVYLVFVIGLEFEINHFHHQKKRSLGFANLTFFIPLFLGTLVGHSVGWGWNTSILIGSLLASYTPLAYPIISHLGLINNQAVTMTMRATVFTNLMSVLVLGVCSAITNTSHSWVELLTILIRLSIYTTIILLGLDWAGKEFFHRSGDEEGNQFLFVLAALFFTAVGAQFIGIEKIVGAFLAGLAVNEAVGEGPVKEKVVFVGSVLFIPIFFVSSGLMLDPTVLTSINTLKLSVAIIVALVLSKLLAASLAKVFYNYNWQEMLTIWSLSMPQMSVTLATAVVGYQAGLLPESVLHAIVILMVFTSILGPAITSRSAIALSSKPLLDTNASGTLTKTPSNAPENNQFHKIVVPVHNPQTQKYLIEMAAILANQKKGKILPLAITTAAAHMDAPDLEAAFQRSELLLSKAMAQSRFLGVAAEPLLRIDDAFAPGISRAAREQKATLILMGWGQRTGLRARLFGNVIDNVIWASHCPVAVTRLVESPKKIQRILVPWENLTFSTFQPIHFAQTLAEANQAHVTVLNICDRRTSDARIADKRSQINTLISQLEYRYPPEIEIIVHENVPQAILQATRLYDLVVLPFIRNRSIPCGLSINDVTTELTREISCSIVMLGEPQRDAATAFMSTKSHSLTSSTRNQPH